jgi:acid phosphatase
MQTTIRSTRLSLLLLLLAALSGCATRPVVAPEPVAAVAPAIVAADENLNAVLWFQTAAEYEALLLQIYADATEALSVALADPNWSAAPEQLQPPAGLRPAVVVDLDETFLDNSAYQARLLRDGARFNDASWNAWCEERRATAVPGALEFAQAAAALGIELYYVSNRDVSQQQATIDNLRALGFPNADAEHMYLRDRERGWAEKGPRRVEILRSHRILLMVGDNLGDFSDEYKGSLGERQQLLRAYRPWWGERWFMLPNPMYGSWEQALINYDYSQDAATQNRLRRDALRMD